MAFDPSKFTVRASKPLPVILMLDTSGSMSGEKIQSLNDAVREMLKVFADSCKLETEILVSVVTFGPVEVKIPFTSAANLNWQDLYVTGDTPIGEALRVTKSLIEDRNIVPSRAYRPTVVLVSDGCPTDSWKTALKEFVSEGRSSKCDRMAMAIGYDADADMLGRFIEGTGHGLFTAADASQISDFFKFVTMSVTTRTQSKNPNDSPNIAMPSSKNTNGDDF